MKAGEFRTNPDNPFVIKFEPIKNGGYHLDSKEGMITEEESSVRIFILAIASALFLGCIATLITIAYANFVITHRNVQYLEVEQEQIIKQPRKPSFKLLQKNGSLWNLDIDSSQISATFMLQLPEASYFTYTNDFTRIHLMPRKASKPILSITETGQVVTLPKSDLTLLNNDKIEFQNSVQIGHSIWISNLHTLGKEQNLLYLLHKFNEILGDSFQKNHTLP